MGEFAKYSNQGQGQNSERPHLVQQARLNLLAADATPLGGRSAFMLRPWRVGEAESTASPVSKPGSPRLTKELLVSGSRFAAAVSVARDPKGGISVSDVVRSADYAPYALDAERPETPKVTSVNIPRGEDTDTAPSPDRRIQSQGRPRWLRPVQGAGLVAVGAMAAIGASAYPAAAEVSTVMTPKADQASAATIYETGQQSSIERIGWGPVSPVGYSEKGPNAWYLAAQGTMDGREPPNGALITLERNPHETPWTNWDVNFEPVDNFAYLRLSLRYSHNHDKALVGKRYKNPGGTAYLGLQDGPGSRLLFVTADPNYRTGTIVNPENTAQVLSYPRKLSTTGQDKHVLVWATEASARKEGEGTIWEFPPTEPITVEAQPDSVRSNLPALTPSAAARRIFARRENFATVV